jgi:predicted ArsR family transcriptional regulator
MSDWRSIVSGHKSKRAIWAFVSQHPDTTLEEIADGVGLSKSGVYHHVEALLKTGILVAPRDGTTGSRKTRVLRAPVPLITVKDGSQ